MYEDIVKNRQCVVEACAFDVIGIVEIGGFNEFDEFLKFDIST